MPIKKKKRVVKKKGGFFDAARIAAELGNKKKVSSNRQSAAKKSLITAVPTSVSVTKKSFSEGVASNTGGHHRSLLGVAKEANSSGDIVGYDDLDEEALREEKAFIEEEKKVSNEGFSKVKLKEYDSKSSGVIEMIGGAAMILIIVEIVVIALILISMFFLK